MEHDFTQAEGGIKRAASQLSFRTKIVIWWTVWLGLLVLLFSGLQLTVGSLRLTTLHLDGAFIGEWWLFVSRGITITLGVSLISLICATLLALLAALARLSQTASLYSLAGLYISLIRGTPLYLQFILIYFALPQLGIVLEPFTSAVVALSLNYGAYMSEIFRAGIEAIDRGQTEASYALGMTPWQTMRRIVLPQAFRVVVPDIGNQFISMQKDTSLASAVTLQELMGRARQAGLPRQHFFEALIIAAVWYWLMTIVLSYLQARLEKRLSQSDKD